MMELLESISSLLATAAFEERAVAQMQPITNKQSFKHRSNIWKQKQSQFCPFTLSTSRRPKLFFFLSLSRFVAIDKQNVRATQCLFCQHNNLTLHVLTESHSFCPMGPFPFAKPDNYFCCVKSTFFVALFFWCQLHEQQSNTPRNYRFDKTNNFFVVICFTLWVCVYKCSIDFGLSSTIMTSLLILDLAIQIFHTRHFRILV